MDTKYHNCGTRPRSEEKQAIYDKSIELKTLHDSWGAGRLHVELVSLYGSKAPNVRTLQRWYKAERYTEPKMRHNEPAIGKSRGVHNIWQVDAKEQIILLGQTVACYLTFTDEYSGAWLGSIVFPYHRISQVPIVEVRAACVKMFEKWGKAGSFRVDNGEPLGNPKMNSTSALALWLIAMDVDMIWNKPRSPQQNAKVERLQGTSSRWVELPKCANIATLQERLDAEAIIQREKLVVRRLNNQTRLAAYPALATSKRVFDIQTLDAQRVYDFLSKKIYVRKVSADGTIVLYNQRYNIQKKHRHKTVEIKFNQTDLTWEIFDNQTLLAAKKATYLSLENIQNLTVYTDRIVIEKP